MTATHDPYLDIEPRTFDMMANGLRHRVLEWAPAGESKGSAPTVLCLHGFLDLSWGWQPVAARLAERGLRVLAFDFRGHGDSDRIGPGGYYHFQDYLLDLAELSERLLGSGPIRLAGHSMGGGVASYFAAAFPERVARLAILEGIGLVDEPLDEAVRRVSDWVVSVRRARARRARAYPTVEAAAERLLEVDPKTSRELARFLAVHGTRRTDDGWVFKHDALHLTRGPNMFQLELARTFWRAVRCPVLLVDGAESEMQHLPDLAERYALFDKGRRVTIPGAGHMMIRHRPAEVAEALAGFFAEERAA